MTRKQKIDEAGDSDELQALFDSIATTSVQAEPEPARAASRIVDDGSGDSDDLQALFDEVASEFETTEEEGNIVTATALAGAEGSASAAAGETRTASTEEVFTRIGQMTRKVHDTLRNLGGDDTALLADAVQAIPDARQRLSYIAQMTEQAASRVLNATDIAQPLQDKVQADAGHLQQKWDRLFANQLGVEEFKVLATETRQFLGDVTVSSQATSEQLMEIMMAQDFQDLTGQVIKKVVELAQKLESELLQLLLEVAPVEKRMQSNEGLLNGPVVNSENRDDVVTSQEQVDDLLDSLGF